MENTNLKCLIEKLNVDIEKLQQENEKNIENLKAL